MRPRNRMLVASAASVPLLLSAAPASAEVLDEPDPIGHVELIVSTATGGYDVCYTGRVTTAARVTGLWTVLIAGTTTTTPTTATSSGSTLDGCRFVSRSGLPAGQILATVSYAGGGATISTSVLALSAGGATWTPLFALPYAVDLRQ